MAIVHPGVIAYNHVVNDNIGCSSNYRILSQVLRIIIALDNAGNKMFIGGKGWGILTFLCGGERFCFLLFVVVCFKVGTAIFIKRRIIDQ